ncbi:MAG: beta strand repeat-containing protein, partial [Planctomycetia bacterium]
MTRSLLNRIATLVERCRTVSDRTARGLSIAPRSRLHFESLEDRAVPAMDITITAPGDVSETVNDFTVLQNALATAVDDQRIILVGTFDWSAPFAAAAYQASVAGSDDGDIRGIKLPGGVDDFTLTTSTGASILGRGDFEDNVFDAFFYADDSTSANGGLSTVGNLRVTIENLTINDFESAVVFGWNSTGTFTSTMIRDNTITVAGDDFGVQNIAVYFSAGMNQQILRNDVTFQGDGTRSIGTGARSFFFQNSTTGGTLYSGLNIAENVLRVGAGSNGIETVIGIWENGHNDVDTSVITIADNQFLGRAGDLFDRGLMLTSQTDLMSISGNLFQDVDNVFFARNASGGTDTNDSFTFGPNTLVRVGGADGVFLQNVTNDDPARTVVINWDAGSTIDGFTGIRGLNELSTQATGSPRMDSAASNIAAVIPVIARPTVVHVNPNFSTARFSDGDGLGTGETLAFGYNAFTTVAEALAALGAGGTLVVNAPGEISATVNDFTILQEALATAVDGRTIRLVGTFDWTTPFSSASYEASEADSDFGDIRGIKLPSGVDDFTLTTSTGATIIGRGDYDADDYDVFFYADESFAGNGGTNAVGNLRTTIENLTLTNFEGAVYFGWNITGNYTGTTIRNNTITIDGDDFDFQNIAVYFAEGKNQTVVGNDVTFAGDGVPPVGETSFSFFFQNNTTGSDLYDGLSITNNVLRVGATSNGMEQIVGIWENSHNDTNTSVITIADNQFLGRTGDLFDRGLMLTSQTDLLSIRGNLFQDVDDVYFARDVGRGTDPGDVFTFGPNTLVRVGGADGVFLRNVTDDPTPTIVGITWDAGSTIDGFTGVRGLNELSTQATGSARPTSAALNIAAVRAAPAPTVVYVNPAFSTAPRFGDADGLGTGLTLAFGYNAFATISDAVAAVAAGGTVLVAAGVYNEAVTIAKPLTVTGVVGSPGSVVVMPGAGLDGFTVTSTGVTLADLTVSGGDDGVVVSNVASFGLRNVRLVGNTGDGADVSNVDVFRFGTGAGADVVSANDAGLTYSLGAEAQNGIVLMGVGSVFVTTFAGDDTITVAASLTRGYTVDAGGPIAPATPGDSLTVNLAGLGLTAADVTVVPGGTGAATLDFSTASGVENIAFRGVETFATMGLNLAPVAGDDAYAVDEDGVLTVGPAAGVLADDLDDGGMLTAALLVDVEFGTLVLNPDGSFTYTPDANFFGFDSFTYTASDGVNPPVTATVTLTVRPIADAAGSTPGATDEDMTTPAGQLVITPNAVDMGTVGFFQVTGIANGLLFKSDGVTPILNGDFITVAEGAAGLRFTPNLNFFGMTSFGVQASTTNTVAGLGGGVVPTAVMVASVNDQLVVGVDPVTFPATEDTTATVRVAALITAAGITDVDDTVFDFTVVPGSAVNGTAVFDPMTGVFSFTPAANFFGLASFQYTVSDGEGMPVSGTIQFMVASVNDQLVVGVDPVTFPATEDTTATVTVAALIAAAGITDVDDTVFVFTVVPGSAVNGTAVFDPMTGAFSFTPNLNFSGFALFRYTVSDGEGTPVTGTIQFMVAAVNDQLVVGVDPAAFSATEDTTATVTVTSLITAAGITDADDTLFVFTVVPGSAVNGVASFNPMTGVFSFTPAANFSGLASFQYTVSDGEGTPVTGTIQFMVAAVNDAPVIGVDPASFGATEDVTAAVPVAALGVTDVDDTVFVFTVVPGSAVNGTAVFNAATGLFNFTPTAGFAGLASFQYTVSDGEGAPVVGTITFMVAAVNDQLVVGVDPAPFNATEDTTTTVTVAELIAAAGITDADDAVFVFTVVPGSAVNGTAAFNPATGVFTFTPAADFVGVASFQYTVTAGIGAPVVGTIQFTVAAVNDAPDFTGRDVAAVEDAGATVVTGWAVFSAGPVNEAAQTAEYVVDAVSNPTLFAVAPTISPDGTLRFTPAANAFGASTITVRVRDSLGGLSAAKTFTISVTGVNDAPTLANGTTPATLRVRRPAVATDLSARRTFRVSQLLGSRFGDADGATSLGIAVTSAGNGRLGVWQYRSGRGPWRSLAGASTTRARLLRSTDQLRFVPAAGATGVARLR